MISCKGAHFPQDIILTGVRWYVAYPLATGMLKDFVAHFTWEVMKGQLPWSVKRLRRQGVEQFSRSTAFVSLCDHPLPFLDHAHQFNTNQGVLGCIE